MMQQNLVLIKPDAIKRNLQESILNILSQNFKLKVFKPKIVTPNQIISHYNSLDERFNERAIKYFTGQEVIPVLIEGDRDCISKSRSLIGDTDPLKAVPDSIRGLYGIDSLQLAIKEDRLCENLIHASDSQENFLREKKIWLNEEDFSG